jgi:hypothetical protein
VSGRIALHPVLVEEAVWAALRGTRAAAEYQRARDPIYRLPDPEERDAAFARLASAWFDRLSLVEPLRRAVEEQGEALDAAGRILAVPAARDRDQGAELYVAGPEDRSIVVALRPETFVDPDRALPMIRRELTHVADMLDPAFAYEPALPAMPSGPARDRLLQDRYRVLWNCSVEGRLRRRGLVPGTAREALRREFAAVFVLLGERTEACFTALFDGPRPPHPDLVAMAMDPRAGFGLPAGEAAPGDRCPLCAFPTGDFEPRPDDLPEEARAAIGASFPAWGPDRGLCRQCADLYRARARWRTRPEGPVEALQSL